MKNFKIEKDSLEYLLYFFVCGDERKLEEIYKKDEDIIEITEIINEELEKIKINFKKQQTVKFCKKNR